MITVQLFEILVQGELRPDPATCVRLTAEYLLYGTPLKVKVRSSIDYHIADDPGSHSAYLVAHVLNHARIGVVPE